jgi:hypothetical protein
MAGTALLVLACGQAHASFKPLPADLPDAPTPQATEAAQAKGSIAGEVLDSAGAGLGAAHVLLSADAPAHMLPRECITNADGSYAFADVPTGAYHLTAAAAGFTTQAIAVTVAAGQALQPDDMTLSVASTSDVQVTATQQEIAQAEITLEEHQRVLGVIPNFYVSYVPNPEPLTVKQKYVLALRTFADPTAFIGTGMTAGIQQADGLFKGYGNGFEGYSKRYAAAFGDGMFGTLIGGAVLPGLLHQDPRYFYKGTGSKRSRFWYAIAATVRCKGDNGHWQFNTSGIAGGLIAGGISNLYYPKADRQGWSLTFESAGFGLLGGAVGNLFQEFLIKKLTPHVPNYSPAP